MNDRDFLAIDLERLDSEWARQPELYYEWATKLADAQRGAAEAKDQLELIEAETSRTIRREPEKFGLTKVTEDGIRTAVVMSMFVREAKAKMIDAEHAVGVMKALVFALDNKKKGLESAVQLRLANYFSTPRQPKHVADDATDRAFGKRKEQANG